MQVEHVPVRVHPEERRIEPRVPASKRRRNQSAELEGVKSRVRIKSRHRNRWRIRHAPEVVELLPEEVGEPAGVGGGRRLRVGHREHVVQVLGPQRLRPPEPLGQLRRTRIALAAVRGQSGQATIGMYTYLVWLQDVGEEGVRRAVAVGQADRQPSAAAAAEPGVGLGVPQRVVHRLLLLRERRRHRHRHCRCGMRERTAAYRDRERESGGVGVRSNLAGLDSQARTRERSVRGPRDSRIGTGREPLGFKLGR
jgi:hypothetical protein